MPAPTFDELVRAALASRGPRLTLANPFLELGRYPEQLARYRNHFPVVQIGVFYYEVSVTMRPATLAGIYQFLGVDPAFLPDMSTRHRVRRSAFARNVAGNPQRLEAYYGLTPSSAGRFKYRPTSASAVRTVNARTVSVGFPEGFCGNADAPSTNRFGICQCCSHGLHTEVSGDAPMMAPPCKCELLYVSTS